MERSIPFAAVTYEEVHTGTAEFITEVALL